MLPCTARAWVTDPVGHYLLGDHFLMWCDRPDRAGTIVWGRIDEREAERLVALWEFELRLSAPYDAAIDLGGLTAIDPGAFEVVARYMQGKLPALAARVRRQALVRPAGMVGAVVAGFYPTLQPGFEWRDFADGRDAFSWCWPEEPALRERVEELVATARDGSPLLARLRDHVRGSLSRPSVAETARALGCAPRTLQRELRQAGTSFRREVQEARIAAACALLRDTELKVDAIARRVGCASVSSFTVLFRRMTSQTPAAYRSRERASM